MSAELLSILNEDGSCAAAFRGLVPDEELLAIFRTLLLNRAMDRRLMALQRQGRLSFYLTSAGEEAVAIGAAYALRDEDPIFLTYRELGVLLWRQVPLEAIVNQLIGNARDLGKGRQMPVHYAYREYHIPSVSSPVGTQLPHACGFGYAAKIRATGQVALAFCGEGTTSEGDFHTALDKAAIVRPGRDASLVAYGAMMEVAQQSALLAEGEGYDVEVIDLLSILPYDLKTVLSSVEKTGRLLVVQEAPRTCGFAAELIAEIQQRAFTPPGAGAPKRAAGPEEAPPPAQPPSEAGPARSEEGKAPPSASASPRPSRGTAAAGTQVLSVSLDHRIVDGFECAQFVQGVKQILERGDFPEFE